MKNRARRPGLLFRTLKRMLAMGVVSVAFGALAEVRPLVVVGASPIQIGTTRGTLAKEEAIEGGLWEGVLRVARDLLERQAADAWLLPPESELDSPEAWPYPPAVPSPLERAKDPAVGTVHPEVDPYSAPDFADTAAVPGWTELEAQEHAGALLQAAQIGQEAEERLIREALGREMVSYTKSYRIVEDQGERPALFTDEPDVATEYVVLLEVQVETDRVRARLEEAGLLRPQVVSELTGIRIEILGLTHYRGYQALLDVLRSDAVSAEDVLPRHFSPGRVVVQVEGEWEPDQLLERLQAASPENLSIEVATPEPSLDPAPGSTPSPWRNPVNQPPGPGKMVLRAAWGPLPPLAPPEPSPAALESFPADQLAP
jgi:hypothetical protein